MATPKAEFELDLDGDWPPALAPKRSAIARKSAPIGSPATTQPTQKDPVGIYLYWLPLGAGGVGFVRWNGRLYEAIKARLEGRTPLDLYHAALLIELAESRYVVENAWPSPDTDVASRGVVLEGPVFSCWLARYRPFRYEVRCWREGVIDDAQHAVEIDLIDEDLARAERVLDLVAGVPAMIWGRDQLRVGEMWNSNSVISYLLTQSGVSVESILAPAGGRAPGWEAGIQAARSQQEDTVNDELAGQSSSSSTGGGQRSGAGE